MSRFFLKSLIVYFLFTFNSYATPCSAEKIKFELEKMMLDPFIQTNNELLTNVKFIYGDKMLAVLTKEHPFIENNPSANINRDTLYWLNDMIWDKDNKFVVYRYFPGDLSSQDALDYFVGDMISALESRQRTVPIFQHKESAELFDILLKPGSENELKKIIERLKIASTDSLNELLTQRFLSHFRKYNESRIGFNFLPNEKIILEISGHGKAGIPGYIVGDKLVSVSEIVYNLIDMGLPLHSSVRLIGCFTACNSETTPYSSMEVKQLFQQRRINEIYDLNQSTSFLKAFSDELKNQQPLFRGQIVGYIGEVMDKIEKKVFSVNGEYVTAFSVKVTATDGQVSLKREESSFYYDHAI